MERLLPDCDELLELGSPCGIPIKQEGKPKDSQEFLAGIIGVSG